MKIAVPPLVLTPFVPFRDLRRHEEVVDVLVEDLLRRKQTDNDNETDNLVIKQQQFTKLQF